MAGKFNLPFMAYYSMSKSAVISFSHTLRREMKNSGVKLCTILPSSFQTKITSDDFIRDMAENKWRNTDESVQRVYGETPEIFVQKFLKVVNRFMFDSPVVDTVIIDALRNEDPESTYVVTGSALVSLMDINTLVEPQAYQTFYQMVYR